MKRAVYEKGNKHIQLNLLFKLLRDSSRLAYNRQACSVLMFV